MTKLRILVILSACIGVLPLWAASDLAPSVPDLQLPPETESTAPETVSVAKPAPVATAAPKKAASKRASSRKRTASKSSVPVTKTASEVNTEEIVVDNLTMTQDVVEQVKVPQLPPVTPVAPKSEQEQTQPAAAANKAPAATASKAPAAATANKTPTASAANTAPVATANKTPTASADKPVSAGPKEVSANKFEPAREKTPSVSPKKTLKVAYNPKTDRDPTLSQDDTLLLKHREEERLRAIELEKQRKLEAERRRLAELERQRQLELERLRDPSREIRGKIRINGIIGQEVFIGNKVYTVGKSVLGARIISVQPDSVVFMYKGQKFTKKVQL